jgi:ATP-dependent Clp protease ATP-binding subunit ClpB
LQEKLRDRWTSWPQVVGQAAGSLISPRLQKVFDQAIQEAAQMKDDFTSTEHLLLALLTDPELQKLFQSQGIERDTILKALFASR